MDRIKPIDVAKLLGVEQEYDNLLLEQEIKVVQEAVMGESTVTLDYTPIENEFDE